MGGFIVHGASNVWLGGRASPRAKGGACESQQALPAADDQLEAYNALVRAIFWLVAELPQGKGGPMPLPHHPQ
jgi:hypothetical protein